MEINRKPHGTYFQNFTEFVTKDFVVIVELTVDGNWIYSFGNISSRMFPAHCDTLKTKMSKSSRLRCPRLCGAGSMLGWVRAVPCCAVPLGSAWALASRSSCAPTSTCQHTRPCPSPHAGSWADATNWCWSRRNEPNGTIHSWLRDALCMKKTLQVL